MLTALQLAEPLVIAAEGFRSLAYDDATGKTIVPGSLVEGHVSIAWGFALDTHGLGMAECRPLLQNRLVGALADAQAAVGPAVWARLDPVRQAALVDMAYEMGRAGLAGFHQMLAALAAGDWAAAAARALDSAWDKQATGRAERDAAILRTGIVP